jgi:hypothetical protein
MDPLAVASVGPLTSLVEAVAASIGSGAVIGGFLGGIEGGLSRRPRAESERRAVVGSYGGGVASLAFLAIDIVRKHFV